MGDEKYDIDELIAKLLEGKNPQMENCDKSALQVSRYTLQVPPGLQWVWKLVFFCNPGISGGMPTPRTSFDANF